MDQPPLVSVILAYRNTVEYLPECLDSILGQTYPHWELIAVNDRSNDGADALLAEYAAKDPRIRTFNSPGERLNPALQEGQKHIRGTLLNRMDSDDRMPADKLEAMVGAWQAVGQGHVIAGGTEHFRDDGEVGPGFKRYDAWLNHVAKEGRHLEEIYTECVIPSHCWMMHVEDFFAVGGFTDIYPEDYDLTFRIYQHGLTIVGLDKVLHHWRDRSERISRTWDEYQDNRYFELKLRYFLPIDRDPNRPLVLWGAGRNGKDMARLLQAQGESFHWVCDNPNKIGHNVYGVILEPLEAVLDLDHPQVLVVVASPDGKAAIRTQLEAWDKHVRHDFWFFA